MNEKMKTIYGYGDPDSSNVLIQMVDDHDLAVIDSEIRLTREAADDFYLIAIKVNDWNADLSPWKAPAVFGSEDFGDRAEETLKEVLKQCSDNSKEYYIGGYSLAGLFALWAVCRTDRFAGAAAASPSIWFPGFVEYMKENRPQCSAVYLSLGDKEEKVRNPVLSKVGNCIRETYAWLTEQGIRCKLEWNKGNHFKEPDVRTAKAFKWILGNRLRCPFAEFRSCAAVH